MTSRNIHIHLQARRIARDASPEERKRFQAEETKRLYENMLLAKGAIPKAESVFGKGSKEAGQAHLEYAFRKRVWEASVRGWGTGYI